MCRNYVTSENLLGNLRYISVIVTRSCHKSKKREIDFLKNCSDLINKKRNKRCLRQLWTVVTSFNFRLNNFQYRYKKIHICIPRYIPFFLPLSLFFFNYTMVWSKFQSALQFCNERKIDELVKFYKVEWIFYSWMNKKKNIISKVPWHLRKINANWAFCRSIKSSWYVIDRNFRLKIGKISHILGLRNSKIIIKSFFCSLDSLNEYY